MKKIVVFLYQKPAFLFFVFTLTAFLPVILPSFYIKNDLVTQILPTRFIISESIHSGFSPWWNPYINYGIPQYSDMACGFWNPLLWIIAILFRYNIWTITYEELLYIFLSGLSFYLVLKELGLSKPISITGGLSYMCSGYIIGHLQHFCWITGAAFLPFVFLYFLRVNKNPGAKNFVSGAVAGFLFLSSTHPGLIIGAVYFFIFCVAGIFLFKRFLLQKGLHPAILRNNLLLLGGVLILSVCIIAAYAEAIPFLTRGEKLPGRDTVSNATTLQSWLSILFPLVVHKSAFFKTDISMRNVYTGLLTLPGLCFFFKYGNRRIAVYCLSVLVFFILLSAGGIFKMIANFAIPFASYVRSAGEFSLFSVFICLLAGAAGFQYIVVKKIKSTRWIPGLKIAGYLFLLLLAGSVFGILLTRNSFLFSPVQNSGGSLKEHIKNTIDGLSAWDLLFIQCAVGFASIYFLARALKKENNFRVAGVLLTNLVIVSWLTLPFTGVGAKSKKEVDALLSVAPAGIVNQALVPANDFSVKDTGYIAFTGLPYTYLKIMGGPEWSPYPIHLKNNAAFFSERQTVSFINQQPFLFLSRDTTVSAPVNQDTSAISVITTGPGFIKAFIRNRQFSYITLLQNDYIHWQVYIDGRKTAHFTGYRSFITTPVPAGEFTIEYRFQPTPISRIGWINLFLLGVALIFILFYRGRPVADKNNPEKIQ